MLVRGNLRLCFFWVGGRWGVIGHRFLAWDSRRFLGKIRTISHGARPGEVLIGGAFLSPEPRSGGESMRIRAFFLILTVSGLRNFSKIFLKKVWRIVKKQYFCGPVSRERGRGGSEAEGAGAAGKKLFEKFF